MNSDDEKIKMLKKIQKQKKKLKDTEEDDSMESEIQILPTH